MHSAIPGLYAVASVVLGWNGDAGATDFRIAA
jgi:hypothetical protein